MWGPEFRQGSANHLALPYSFSKSVLAFWFLPLISQNMLLSTELAYSHIKKREYLLMRVVFDWRRRFEL